MGRLRARLLDGARLRAVQAEVSRLVSDLEALAVPLVGIIPEASACPRRIAATGVPLGIVSSNDAAVVRQFLEREGFAARFAAVVGRDEVVELKPSAEGLALCCRRLAVDPGRAVYIGDMGSDIVAARAAGVFSVGILTGLASRDDFVEAGADLILSSLAELPERFGG